MGTKIEVYSNQFNCLREAVNLEDIDADPLYFPKIVPPNTDENMLFEEVGVKKYNQNRQPLKTRLFVKLKNFVNTIVKTITGIWRSMFGTSQNTDLERQRNNNCDTSENSCFTEDSFFEFDYDLEENIPIDEAHIEEIPLDKLKIRNNGLLESYK